MPDKRKNGCPEYYCKPDLKEQDQEGETRNNTVENDRKSDWRVELACVSGQTYRGTDMRGKITAAPEGTHPPRRPPDGT